MNANEKLSVAICFGSSPKLTGLNTRRSLHVCLSVLILIITMSGCFMFVCLLFILSPEIQPMNCIM